MKELTAGIVRLVRAQGEKMRNAHDVENDSRAIKVKPGDANFVTVYDEAVQNSLIEGLKKLLPGAVFFAEEKDNSAVDSRSGWCFVIDPIDGTTNFIHDMKSSAISVGLLKDGKPYLGVIYDPYLDEVFTATEGNGAYLNGKPIRCSTRTLDKALFAFGTSPYNKEKLGKKSFAMAYKLFMRTADVRRSGSAALDICNVACGRTDAYAECILSPWDFAAGLTILKEAGASVSDFDGNNLRPDTASSFLCANGVIYKEILNIISEED